MLLFPCVSWPLAATGVHPVAPPLAPTPPPPTPPQSPSTPTPIPLHPTTLQARPLSPGEVLGCTAPRLEGGEGAWDALLFVADGRFHLEALMIANPTLPAYRYDPYGRLLTREVYDQEGMRGARRAAVEAARATLGGRRQRRQQQQEQPQQGQEGQEQQPQQEQGQQQDQQPQQQQRLQDGQQPSPLPQQQDLEQQQEPQQQQPWGLVLGTLGRQGSPAVLARLQAALAARGQPYVTVLLSEVTPAKLAVLGRGGVAAWVQIACPRLSIDWGEGFSQPTLNPYEARGGGSGSGEGVEGAGWGGLHGCG